MSSLTAAPSTALAIDWEGTLEDSLNPVIDFVPKLLVFLVILFIGWLIAKAVAKFLGIVLQRVGFTTLLSKAGADRALTSASVNPLDIICKLAYYFILLIALQLALSAFGPSNPVSEIVNDIVRWLPQAVVAIVIVVIAGAVANAVKDLLTGVLGGVSYGPLLAKIASGFIVALGVIAALNQIGIGLSVTMPVLIAVLATVGGILVVGVGGGLIAPMRDRWERWLDQLASETAGNGTHVDPAAASYGTGPGATPTPPPPPPSAGY
ncbi:small-conductance mechanosensitive channel [Nocardioides thalensis]|uniref:Small-conductance mechanosensitive channel n=1 Tax=Nocardioides thalensis TaxID=1914755 RepID=A0A853BXI0_9ACTN|nr:hypothetical protein [Nocardioides thalensis]NYI99773.1 small-conductance mechanosensitive channel [Nocardioides thalensis]